MSTEETEEAIVEFGGLASFDSATQIVSTAIENGMAAAEPDAIGDFGEARMVPSSMTLIVKDVRDYEDRPRSRSGVFSFVSPDSVVQYAERYLTANSLVYGHDPHGKGVKMLTSSNTVLDVVLDDHPADGAANRDHYALMKLRPTEEATRWGNALGNGALDQEQALDLFVDGVGEIADPPAASLRDLVSDLHAIRTSEVTSVVRTGGEGKIVVSENVKLHAGSGTDVSFPETMNVTFQPFVDVAEVVGLTIRIKPRVVGNKVNFKLSCAGLDDALATISAVVANNIGSRLDREVMWLA